MRYLQSSTTKIKLNCHFDIDVYLNITKCLKIDRHIFKSVESNIRNKSWKASEKRYKKVLGNFLFLVIRPS